MGWGYGHNAEGREIGYNVEATCDHPECDKQIDRGLEYCCGGMHDGGKYGCGQYFCYDHLYAMGNLCKACMKNLPECPECEDVYFPGEDFCSTCHTDLPMEEN